MLREQLHEKEDLFKLSTQKDIKIGEKITGTYSKDLDIWKIHMIVRDIFSYFSIESSSIQDEIRDLRQEISKSGKSFMRTQSLKEDLKKLESELEKFSSENWLKYTQESRSLLDKYSKITTYRKTKTIRIGGASKSKPETEDASKLEERLDIIRKYLRIVDKLITTDIVFVPPYQIQCETCKLELDEMQIDEDQGVYVCECHNIYGKVYSSNTVHVDPDKIDSGSKNSYDDKTNFLRRLKSYQGVQSRKISKELLDSLDSLFQNKYKHPPASEIRKMPMDSNGHRGPTSVPLLIEALRETGNSIHFQDINPICYELWGWKCPDIEHLVPSIMKDYTRTQEVYKQINPNLSSINVELRLYWHLRIAGHDCLLEDFKIPHSIDSKIRYSEVFKEMCRQTNLKFYPIL